MPARPRPLPMHLDDVVWHISNDNPTHEAPPCNRRRQTYHRIEESPRLVRSLEEHTPETGQKVVTVQQLYLLDEIKRSAPAD
jgi:hypothetical protein